MKPLPSKYVLQGLGLEFILFDSSKPSPEVFRFAVGLVLGFHLPHQSLSDFGGESEDKNPAKVCAFPADRLGTLREQRLSGGDDPSVGFRVSRPEKANPSAFGMAPPGVTPPRSFPNGSPKTGFTFTFASGFRGLALHQVVSGCILL